MRCSIGNSKKPAVSWCCGPTGPSSPEWALREARSGDARKVNLPVLVDGVEPPTACRHLQATNLVGWSGGASGHAIESLIKAITELIGRELLPVDLNLVTGDRQHWVKLGPTVNMVPSHQRGMPRGRAQPARACDEAHTKPAYELAWHPDAIGRGAIAVSTGRRAPNTSRTHWSPSSRRRPPAGTTIITVSRLSRDWLSVYLDAGHVHLTA
jgi:hypothetical protein